MLKLIATTSKLFIAYSSFIILKFLRNYFDGLTKLFSDLTKFLANLAKSFFSCKYCRCYKISIPDIV